VISLLLIVLPWHNLNFGILVAAILILVISLIWSREHSERIVRDKRIRRSELLWVILAAALALWEFGANILGIQFKSLYVFPTISVLVDPMLDSQGGKAIFVCMWMAMGLGLLRLVRQR
jgi:heme exporter protein D